MSKAASVGLLLFSVLAVPMVSLSTNQPPVDGPRLIVFPPWENGWQIVEAAGGSPIGPYKAPMGILAYSPLDPAFDARLKAAGAWAVFDGEAIAVLCGLQI